jgi:hypothetical protein
MFTRGRPVDNVFFSAQAFSQMLVRNTSQQGRPVASIRRTRVIFSAARLKEVICQSRSTVKTPSLMESRIVSWWFGAIFAGTVVSFQPDAIWYGTIENCKDRNLLLLQSACLKHNTIFPGIW